MIIFNSKLYLIALLMIVSDITEILLKVALNTINHYKSTC